MGGRFLAEGAVDGGHPADRRQRVCVDVGNDNGRYQEVGDHGEEHGGRREERVGANRLFPCLRRVADASKELTISC